MRVAVVGSDALAMVAACKLSRQGHDVRIFSREPFPESLLEPMIVYKGRALEEFLDSLGIYVTNYRVKTGVLLRGKVSVYPKDVRTQGPDYALRVRRAIYCKTRLVSSVSDPRGIDDERAPESSGGLQFDWQTFTKKVCSVARPLFCRTPLKGLFDTSVSYGCSDWIFDRAVVTLPLWEQAEVCTWPVPYAAAINIHTIKVQSTPVQRGLDLFSSWDRVWTPYTSDQVVHRVWQKEARFLADFSGALTPELLDRLLSDLNFLFPATWAANSSVTSRPGYLCEAERKPTWPKTIHPLGRFAQWDSKANFSLCVDNLGTLIR